MSGREALAAHLETGLTHVCRCWQVKRADGPTLGFTDHDRDLEFEDTVFRADTGLSAVAVQQTTGMAVDNTEAVGALSDASLSHADIEAGRYDNATVTAWLVNWQNPDERKVQFKGHIGEITRGTSAFTAELRGLTDVLNQPFGRVYQTGCSAVVGDKACQFNLLQSGFFYEGVLSTFTDGRYAIFDGLTGFDENWFERGMLNVLTGAAKGLRSAIKFDRDGAQGRQLELWDAIVLPLAVDDVVRITAGCDKTQANCRGKFSNIKNYQGFPTVPGEDWLMASPIALSSRARG